MEYEPIVKAQGAILYGSNVKWCKVWTIDCFVNCMHERKREREKKRQKKVKSQK